VANFQLRNLLRLPSQLIRQLRATDIQVLTAGLQHSYDNSLESLPFGPEIPPLDSPPAVHLAWCERFSLYCSRQAQTAREFDLPTGKWLRAAELVGFAASIWRERAQGVAL